MKLTAPNSWYQATAHQRPELIQAEGKFKTQVCIIGGGFTGLSTALSLAEQGRQVIVLEARRIGWGASGRNGGQMIRGLVGEQRLRNQFGDAIADRLRWMGNDLIHERVSKYQIDCDLQSGWTELAISAEQEMTLRREYEERMNQEPHRG